MTALEIRKIENLQGTYGEIVVNLITPSVFMTVFSHQSPFTIVKIKMNFDWRQGKWKRSSLKVKKICGWKAVSKSVDDKIFFVIKTKSRRKCIVQQTHISFELTKKTVNGYCNVQKFARFEHPINGNSQRTIPNNKSANLALKKASTVFHEALQ